MIPPEIRPYLPEILCTLFGLLAGWWLTRLSAAARIEALNGLCRAEERRATDLDARLAIAREEAERNELDARTIRNQLVELNTRLETSTTDSAHHKQLVGRIESIATSLLKLETSLHSPLRELQQMIETLESRVLETNRRIDNLGDFANPSHQAAHASHPWQAAQPGANSPSEPEEKSEEATTTPDAGDAAEFGSFAAYLQQAEAAERERFSGFAQPAADFTQAGDPPAKVPANALAALARASELSARHQMESPAISLNPQAADALLSPKMDDGFSFVPDPPPSARGAASDLRSALGSPDPV